MGDQSNPRHREPPPDRSTLCLAVTEHGPLPMALNACYTVGFYETKDIDLMNPNYIRPCKGNLC